MLSEAKSPSTPFERNTAKKIPILTADQVADTKRTWIEHLSLLTITIGSKDIIISRHGWATRSSFMIINRSLQLIDGDALIGTFPLGVGQMV